MEELGFPGFDATAWFGLMAPAGTPQPVIDKLHKETVRVLALPDVEGQARGARRSARRQHAGGIRWPWSRPSFRNGRKVIKEAGIKLSD